MLQSALVIVALGGAVAQTYPDQLDILRGADTTPQIELVLDTSYSMGPGSPDLPNSCDWYYAQLPSAPPSPDNEMSRLDLVKAILTGCTGPDDGILDVWANDVIFAVREFGTTDGGGAITPRVDLRANFFGPGSPTDADGIPIGSNLANLQAAVLALSPGGYTPLALAYELAARHFGTDLNDTNSRHCRQNFIVVMTDGDGNYSTAPPPNSGPNPYLNQNTSPSTWNFIAGQPTLQVSDNAGCYIPRINGSPITDPFCAPFWPPFADEAAEYLVRDSGGNIVDALPNVSDTPLASGGTRGQPIRTYAISFEPPSDAEALLFSMAIRGEGSAYTATNFEQLSAAFNNIVASIVPRSQVAFSPGTVQNDGLFSGNYMYQPTFQPVENGHWFGTVKKHCVIPANTSDQTCLFRDDGTGNNTLETNPDMVDIWTNTTERDATVGGAGEQIFDQLFNVPGPNAAVPSYPYSYRSIVTWRPGQSGYVDVDGASSFSNTDTRTSNLCDHFSLVNKLHGFTDEVVDCGANDYDPVGFDSWPLGDTANGGVAILKYTDECESSSSSCFVVTNSNDGMLHVFRGRDGTELSAVIPGELWDNTDINHNQLRDIMDQPNLDQLKRYYFDGGLRLFHEDTNGNGYIDGTETAYLIAGLGRNGYAYYLWDVSSFNGDFSSASAPAPRPLMADEATGFRNLRETWAPPWVGLYRDGAGTYRRVAVFASGHMRELDAGNTAFAVLEPGLPPPSPDTEASPHSLSCTAFGLDAALCSPPIPPAGCERCTTVNPAAGGCPAVSPPSSVYCYDWPGYAGTSSAAPFDNGQPSGHDILFGPFSWAQGNQEAHAYRVVFSRFDLQLASPPTVDPANDDRMEFLDADQNVIGYLSGNGAGSTTPCPGAACSPWIYSPSFYVRVISDGNDTEDVTGWDVSDMQVIRRNRSPRGRPAGGFPVITSNYARPSIYVADLDKWANLPAFGDRPTGNDTRQRDALLVRVTSDCDGLTGTNEICIDETGSGGQPPQPDLRYMVCPISAEPSVYQEGNVFRTVYVGDECGQIWKVDQQPAGGWTVQRILRLNNADASGRVLPNQRSSDYRKIFTRVELVLSRCNGSRSIGVYFGTGNVQRPSALDVLLDPALVRVPGTGFGGGTVTLDSDVIGVVWDSANLPRPSTGLSLEDLENVSNIVEIADTTTGDAANGYFIEIGPGTKALRDPVVFDGVASFKTYQPKTQATECVSATGADVIFTFDNCTAAPVVDTADIGTAIDSTNDRIIAGGHTAIGGGLLVFTPQNGEAFVSTADTNVAAPARLAGPTNRRAMRIYLWRTQVETL